jgi:hypothetical protein
MLKTQLLLMVPCLLVLGLAGGLAVYFRPSAEPDKVEDCAACLPPGITLDTRFRRDGWSDPQTLTVRDRLRELGAYRRARVGFEALYGADGLPIQFYVPRFPRRYVQFGLMPREAVVPVQRIVDPGAAEEEEMASLKQECHLIVLWPIDRPNRMP